MQMNIVLDDGYMFGIGLFETIAVVENHCVLLKEHLDRLNKSLKVLGISKEVTKEVTKEPVLSHIANNPMKNGALKLMVSQENETLTARKNTYEQEQYEQGFVLGISAILRNETSPFTYMKSFNYGDNIIEKRAAQKRGWDETIFLNTHGQICEGATTNLFFVKDKKIYTPPISCGLLEGILRNYVLERYDVVEKILYPADIIGFEEVFVTNSLLGIMPVKQIGDVTFLEKEVTQIIMNRYQDEKMNL